MNRPLAITTEGRVPHPRPIGAGAAGRRQAGRALLALAVVALLPACAPPSARPGAPAAALSPAATMPASATPLRLAALFTDHAVLQRDRPLPVWGWAPPGCAVQATLAGQQGQAVAAEDGRFRITLGALPAGGPHTLVVRCADQAVIRSDLLLGDVWLASGQSNMEWVLRDSDGAAAAIADADQPLIRHLRMPLVAALRPADDTPAAPWLVASPATAGGFSAVAWHFARRWQASHPGVPVGLINTAWGGSHLETWLRRDAALAEPDLVEAVRATPVDGAAFVARRTAAVQHSVSRFQPGLPWQVADSSGWQAPTLDDRAWPLLQAPGIWEQQGLPDLDGVVWLRRTVRLSAAQAAGAATLRLAMVDDDDQTWVNGQPVGATQGWNLPRAYALPAGLLHEGDNLIAVRVTDHGGGGGLHGSAAELRLDTAAGALPLAGAWRARVAQPLVGGQPTANDAPALAHNALHHPLQGLPLRGVLWYQGESNVGRAAAYAGLFQRFISDWRTQWGQPALPFFWVQLAAYRPLADNNPDASPWAELRDAQRQALALPHTGMAVTTDVGDADDIHPRRKREVGERLAALALHDEDPGRPPATGPQLQSVRVDGDTLVSRWTATAGGLATRPSGAPVQGVHVAGADGRFHAATAHIAGDELVARSAAVPQPLYLRYGWLDNPERANLVDGQGLPASPVRSDALPLVTRDARYPR